MPTEFRRMCLYGIKIAIFFPCKCMHSGDDGLKRQRNLRRPEIYCSRQWLRSGFYYELPGFTKHEASPSRDAFPLFAFAAPPSPSLEKVATPSSHGLLCHGALSSPRSGFDSCKSRKQRLFPHRLSDAHASDCSDCALLARRIQHPMMHLVKSTRKSVEQQFFPHSCFLPSLVVMRRAIHAMLLRQQLGG